MLSDSGFSVEVLGRTGLEYREGNRVMFVDSEVLVTRGIAVFTHTIVRWKPPFDGEQVTYSKKQQIIANIIAAFTFFGKVAIMQ